MGAQRGVEIRVFRKLLQEVERIGVKTTHFRVDNGDMTLVELESGPPGSVDCNIADADSEAIPCRRVPAPPP